MSSELSGRFGVSAGVQAQGLGGLENPYKQWEDSYREIGPSSSGSRDARVNRVAPQAIRSGNVDISLSNCNQTTGNIEINLFTPENSIQPEEYPIEVSDLEVLTVSDSDSSSASNSEKEICNHGHDYTFISESGRDSISNLEKEICNHGHDYIFISESGRDSMGPTQAPNKQESFREKFLTGAVIGDNRAQSRNMDFEQMCEALTQSLNSAMLMQLERSPETQKCFDQTLVLPTAVMISDFDIIALTNMWLDASFRNSTTEEKCQRYLNVKGQIENYIGEEQTNLRPDQLQHLQNLINKLDASVKEENVLGRIRTINAIRERIRSGSHKEITEDQSTFFVIGRGNNKDRISHGTFKTVKGGVDRYFPRTIVYMTSRGKKAVAASKQEFAILSLFKGCVGIAQVYAQIEGISIKRGNEIKHIIIEERYLGDLFDLSKDMRSRSSQFSKENQRQIGADLGEALDNLRKQGYVHRDIKPENMFYYQDPETGLIRVVLGDFGFAATENTMVGIGGTLDCLSPKEAYNLFGALQSRKFNTISSQANDVWAVALALYTIFVKIPNHSVSKSGNVEQFFKDRSMLDLNWVKRDLDLLDLKIVESVDQNLLQLILRGLDPNETTRIGIGEFSSGLRALSPTVAKQAEGSSSSESHKRKRDAS